MNAKEKAIKFIKKEPLWIIIHNLTGEEISFHSSVIVREALDIAIKEAKKEMLDVISEYRVKTGCILISESAFALLKKK